MPKYSNEWSLTHTPPEGHDDVGLFAYSLFEAAYNEKERLGLTDRWYENHRLYRGDHWNKGKRPTRNDKNKLVVNLLFANIQRTVANLTARDPVAECRSIDGVEDDADTLLSQRIRNWWNESEQGTLLTKSATQMEIYGPTIEKYVPNIDENQLDVIVKDPFSWFPAPGYYSDIQDMPYMCDAYPMDITEVEAMFGVEGVIAEDTYTLFGQDREENAPIPASIRYGQTATDYAGRLQTSVSTRGVLEPRALVIEVWLRDMTKEAVQIQTGTDPVSGEPIMEESEQLKYPGGIRKITLTNRGRMVLDDTPNPNINPAIPRDLAEKTYAWDKYPFGKACSYEDTTSVWGFSAAEQVGDLQQKINEVLSRIASYINLCCMPPLILPKDCGVTEAKVSNKAGLVLKPASSMASQAIRFLQVPSLPPDFFRVVDLYLGFFDRVFAIQDVDRGETPRNVQAASAIITLQERNAVLMRQKIRAMDYMVRERGRWAISYHQNFGWREETIKIDDDARLFRGTDYVGRRFNYLVESGSTITKTSLQVMQDAKELYNMGVIDRQALLENVNFPGWKEILERTAEGQLNQAIQLLVQAGLPEEDAIFLQQFLSQQQGGPGNRPQNPPSKGQPNTPAAPQSPQPGTPRAQQGQLPPLM